MLIALTVCHPIWLYRRTGKGLDARDIPFFVFEFESSDGWGANSNHTLSTSTGKAQSNSTDNAFG